VSLLLALDLEGILMWSSVVWYAAVSENKIICIIFDGKIEKVKSSL
jgi:hypothetical protein